MNISSSCIDFPRISFQDLEDNNEVSGTITIEGTATAIPSERTITRVSLTIDGDPPVTILNSSVWEFLWDTTKVENGDHTINVRATDSQGCYGEESITVTVSNEASVTPQVFCNLFTCKNTGNSPIYLAVYVYDHEDNPVSGAEVQANILFGSGAGSKTIPATSTPGYYGGAVDPSCDLYTNDETITLPTDSLAIASNYDKYANKSETLITVNVTKDGFLGSTCTIIATD